MEEQQVRSLMEPSEAIPEVRRRLAQRMSMMATLRKVRAEAYQVIQANQAWVDRVMMNSQGT